MPLRPATKGEGALRDAIKSNLIDRLMSTNRMSGVEVKFDFKASFTAHIEAYGKLRHMAPTRLCYLSSQQRGQSVLQRLPDKASLPIPRSHRRRRQFEASCGVDTRSSPSHSPEPR